LCPTGSTQGAPSNYKNSLLEQPKPGFREALGRSRGGLTTKIHLVADRRCRPVVFLTSEGQRHDVIAFTTVLDLVSIRRLGPGRPRTRPDWVLADKAYSSKAHRDYLAGRGIRAAIPIKDDQADARRRKGPRGGRPPSFDTVRYRERNTVERAVNKLRNHRGTATRYDKRDYIYRGTIAVTSIWIWLRDPVRPALPNRP
jgi:transposase